MVMLWNNIEVLGRRLIQSNTLPGETVRSPAVNPQFKAEKTFKARVVLMNRESVLTEDTRLRPSQRFPDATDEGVSTNPAVQCERDRPPMKTFSAPAAFRAAT
jgi:hypothetical protein